MADDGNTIRIFSGTYAENCIVPLKINLTGNGTSLSPESHIVPSSGIPVNITSGNVGLSLLDIHTSSSNPESNIVVDGRYVTIRNCTVGETGGYGIHFLNTYSCIIDNCTIFDSVDAGIFLDNTYLTTVSFCEIFDNNDGLSMDSSIYETITDCKIHDNSDYGINIRDSDHIVINDCDIYDCIDYGLYADTKSNDIDGRFNYWGDITGPGGWGPGNGAEIFHTVEYSPWLGNWVGTEPNQEYFVDYSGSIQAAVDHSTPDDIIYVYYSVYKEQVVIDKTLSLYGLVEIPPYPIIYSNQGVDAVQILAQDVIIQNFNITTSGLSGNGILVGMGDIEADGTSIKQCNVTNVGDNGIHVDYSTNSCTFENCIINGIGKNGIYLDDSIDLAAHDINISSCEIFDCGENGIYIEDRCDDNLVRDCSIHKNAGNGLHILGKRTEVSESAIINNSKNGVFIDGAEDTHIGWGIISQNKGHGVEESSFSSGSDARFNYWGDDTGPGGSGPGLGNGVTANVEYSPWLGLVPESSPMTFYVDPTGSVQTAIDNSTDGDSIRLIQGHFFESVLIHKMISLIGNGNGKDPSKNTILDADNSGTTMIIVSPSTRISNIFIAAGSYGDNDISIMADNVSIDNCTLSTCGGDGIYFVKSTNCIVTNCTIEDVGGNGIRLISMFFFTFVGSDDNLIDNCTITRCGSSGIEIGSFCHGNQILNCLISNNSQNGIFLNGSANCSILNCRIEENQYGIFGRDADDVIVSKSLIIGNIRGTDVDGCSNWKIFCCDIVKNSNYGVFASFSNPSVDARFNHWGSLSGPGGAGPGMGDAVSIKVLYSPWLGSKCGSKPQSFFIDQSGFIQDAISMSRDGDTVYVMNGNYTEHLLIAGSIRLIGSGQAGTKINGLGSGNVITVVGMNVHIEGFHLLSNTPTPMISGIMVQGGNATIKNVLCSSLKTGIIIQNCSGCLLKSVICSENDRGILLHRTTENLLINVSVLSNSFEGILLILANNNTFEGGIIKFNDVGMLLKNGSRGNSVHYNHIFANKLFGVKVEGKIDLGAVNATHNWWGHKNGPFNSRLNPRARGNNITDDIPFSPWLDEEGKPVFSIDTSDDDNGNNYIFDQGAVWATIVLGLIILITFLLFMLHRSRSKYTSDFED